MIGVSIIVAAYNAEKYISKCLDSLTKKTLDNIEIIVVDDGSTDLTGEIILSYESKKILYYRKENGGLSDARNFGLKQSSGEYVAFVDSDDYCEENMYDLLYEKAKEGAFDIVETAYYRDYENYTVLKYPRDYIYGKILYNPAGQWWKLIRRSIIIENNICFQNRKWYEDLNFNTKLLPLINRVGYIETPLYHYVQHDGSIMHTVSSKIFDIYDCVSDIISFFKVNNYWEKYHEDLEYLFAKEILISSGLRCLIYDSQNQTNSIMNNYSFFIKEFPNWKKNYLLKKINKKNIILWCINSISYKFVIKTLRRFVK